MRNVVIRVGFSVFEMAVFGFSIFEKILTGIKGEKLQIKISHRPASNFLYNVLTTVTTRLRSKEI